MRPPLYVDLVGTCEGDKARPRQVDFRPFQDVGKRDSRPLGVADRAYQPRVARRLFNRLKVCPPISRTLQNRGDLKLRKVTAQIGKTEAVRFIDKSGKLNHVIWSEGGNVAMIANVKGRLRGEELRNQ